MSQYITRKVVCGNYDYYFLPQKFSQEIIDNDLVNPKRTIRSWNLPFQNRRAIDIQF